MKRAAYLLIFALTALSVPAATVLLETEQFDSLGGWDLDQQVMDQMGSPYLLAHGLGVPVKDAVTDVTFPAPGTYKVWARTRDWVAPWKARGAPGQFQILLNGQPVPAIFGTEGEEWHWQYGGDVEVTGSVRVALHDLTGFEGRCDALLFSSEVGFTPPEARAALDAFRSKALGLPADPEPGGHYDLVVVGGGIAGTCAAISAARQGLSVALIQDRPVLGGNGSSEVRVWPEGHTNFKPYTNVGNIVKQLLGPRPPGTGASANARRAEYYNDEQKVRLVRAETNITLRLEQRVNRVEKVDGQIRAVVAQHIRTARRLRIEGRFFADCTGDGAVGFLAGADHEVSSEGNMGSSNMWNLMDKSRTQDVIQCECKDKDALAADAVAGRVASPFPRTPWAIDLSEKPFPGRKNATGQWGGKNPLDNLGGWFWESGFDRDPINDIERIRDLNFRAMYGAWDTLKNVDQLYPTHQLQWAAFIAGKRESRRLLGDVVLTGDDFRKGRAFPDACFPCTWHIDMHAPHESYQKGNEGEEFISRATVGAGHTYKSPYWAPYRTLYSRNIPNLFMAGRDISVDREALGAVRVMRTCGMMGEIVGKAASICVKKNTTPRGVYEKHLEQLKGLMEH